MKKKKSIDMELLKNTLNYCVLIYFYGLYTMYIIKREIMSYWICLKVDLVIKRCLRMKKKIEQPDRVADIVEEILDYKYWLQNKCLVDYQLL